MNKKFLFNALLLVSLSIQSLAQISVTGTVSEVASGSRQPMPGVMVVVEGTSTGSMTDSEGRYAIAASENDILLFSSLGYQEKKVAVSGQSVIDVVLELESTLLDELVFVGYGSVKKSDLVTSVTSVSAEDIKVFPAATAAEMLKGKAAGITVTTASGQPGTVPSITIRGSRSISASNTPLYIIDGSVASDTEFAMMSAEDIESIEILKDAASQAIYGARASDGVILVTTKRGKEGKASISYNGYVGIQSLHRNFDLYSGDEWVQLKKDIKANDSGLVSTEGIAISDALADAMMLDVYKTGNYVDWEKLMFKKAALYHNHDISVRGGTDKIRASASLSYFDQDGILRYNSNYKRLGARVNLDYKAKKWLTLGINASFGWAKKKVQNGTFYYFLTRTPLATVYDEEGNFIPYIDSRQDKSPIYQAQHEMHGQDATNYRINAFAEVRPFNGFTYRLNASYYNRTVEEGQSKDSYYLGGGSSASLSDDFTTNILLENIISYVVPFKDARNSLDFTAVQSIDRRKTKSLSLAADNLPVDKNWNFISNGEITSYDRSLGENNLVSFMLRAQYNYDKRYYITASARYDGSSRFGAGHKWGVFPSVALAWRADNEDFLKDIPAVDLLKFRASYGVVGNQNGIGNYTTLGLVQQKEGEFGDIYYLGYLPGASLSNPNLKWEQSATVNVGADFGFFDNRLDGSVEYYYTRTTDLLVSRSLNAALGYTSMLDNLGETRTYGVDFNLSGDIIRRDDLSLTTALTFTHFKNRIVRIDDQVDADGKPMSQPGNGWIIGAPINVYYDYVKDGIYQYDDFDVYDNGNGTYTYLLLPTVDSDKDGIPDAVLIRTDTVEPGSIKIKDLNQDGKIDEKDRQVYRRDPDFTLGWSTSLRWKGFDFNMDWFASVGGTVRNPLLYQEEYGGNLKGVTNGIKVDYWTPENPTNSFPRPTYSKTIQYMSTLGYQNASYLRLRTLQLGYSLPAKAIKKMKVEKLRFYATATNLLTFSKVLSYSPEIMGSKYPEARQFVFGVNFSF